MVLGRSDIDIRKDTAYYGAGTPATRKTKEDLEEKYAGGTCESKLARGTSSEQRSLADWHQPSHLVKMISKDIK